MSIKILHIIPSLNKGGAERLVLTICSELSHRKDLTVQLITFRSDNAYPFLCENISWKVIPASVKPSISGKTKVNVNLLQTEIENFQPDIIHSHLFETEMVLSHVHYPDAKYFVHFHDNMHQMRNLSISTLFHKSRLTDYFEKRIVLKGYSSRPTHFIAISDDTYNYVKSVLPIKFNISLLFNAVDLSRFKSPTKSLLETRIVTIGSLVAKKGQRLAIETIAELKTRGLPIFLDILGDGPLKSEISALIQNLHLEEFVILHGNVDYPEKYLANSLLYLHTAFEEPFGLAIIESMASGLPVVCTDGKGNRDLIQEGKNGFMIWERNPVLLADKIELLIKNEDLRKEMGKNARKFAEGFGIEKYADKLLAIYTGSKV